MLRAIRQISPGWVVGENVFGIINWSWGLVFEQVQADLEAEGYEVQPYVLPACAVDAPHRRDRVWFVAYRNSNGRDRSNSKHEINASKRGKYAFNDVEQIITADTNDTSAEYKIQTRRNVPASENKRAASYSQHERFKEQRFTGEFRSSPTVPSIRGVEPGFRGGNDGFSSRVDRIKALGNAIVPQVAYQIFKALSCTEEIMRIKNKI